MENESADWATRQPVGADFFFFFLQDNDLFWGISAVHTHTKNNSKCLLAKSHAAKHHI